MVETEVSRLAEALSWEIRLREVLVYIMVVSRLHQDVHRSWLLKVSMTF